MKKLVAMKTDIGASIVVFLVALPLAMGVAVASGYPPAAGLVTGIIGGIIVGALSGSPLQVSGAAAGLTVIVYEGVQQFGLKSMGIIIALAGILQVVMAVLRLGRWFQAISPTVLHGMLAGIGVLILAGQAHVMMDRAPAGSGLANLAAIPGAVNAAVQNTVPGSLAALCLGLLAFIVMRVWPHRGQWSLFPAPLAAVMAASFAALLTGAAVRYVEIPPNVFALAAPTLADFSVTPQHLSLALQLALIASAESLLCAGAVDQMHDGKRTRYNRELAAQGVGNVICGFLGALPMTGVIVRSSANVQAGAKTRASAILHGVWLILFVAFLPTVLRYIPVAALAGILVYTGIKLVNVDNIRRLSRRGIWEVGIFAATIGLIVWQGLLFGVVVGLALAGLRLLLSLARLSITMERQQESAEEVIVHLRGAATFLQLPNLSAALERLPPKARVALRSHELSLVDEASMQYLESWRRRYVNLGGEVTAEGIYRFSQPNI